MRCPRRLISVVLQFAVLVALPFAVVAAKKDGGRESISVADMKAKLEYFSSDLFEGRGNFSEGLGLAAAYIADQLKGSGVRPGGDNGTYFQRVKVLGVKSKNQSTVTVEANGQTRTFKAGEEVALPPNVGSKRTFSSDQIEFMGYGLYAPMANHNDYAGKDAKGKVVIWLGAAGPKSVEGQQFRRLITGRARFATEQVNAIASIGPVMGGFGGGMPPQQAPAPAGAPPAGAPAGARPGAPPAGMGGFGGPAVERADFTTVQRLDTPTPPAVSAKDEFFEFILTGQQASYADLKVKAAAREPLPVFTLKNVKITFNLDADYQVVRTQYTRNVVGIVDGKDSQLKNTYIAYGAHYDHLGYAEGEVVQTDQGPRRAGAPGRVKDGAIDDRIWNGADDDGSGTIAVLEIAKAFAQGPKPRRSLLFMLYTGEERGLWGSRFFADYPSVPIESVAALVNMDMIGRNSDDKPEQANAVYVVGSDRISTELHNLTVDSNAALSQPLKLDYELNDPADLEQVYYRSDHYPFAAKGIPAVFLTSGLHPDYHFNTDSSEKINYGKMLRVVQLAYEIGYRAGNLDHPPARDNKGPRVGKGSTGKITQ